MANRAFHIATKGSFNYYGVRRCSSHVPSAVGWCEHHHHSKINNSHPARPITPATPIISHLNYCHQSQSLREICRNTALVHRRLFSGTTSDKSGNVDAAASRSGNIDRSKFTHEVKIVMPNLDDNVKGVIEKWYKKEGDIIKKDEVICDIRTELFTFGMLTDDDFDSIMGVIHVPEGSDPVEHGTIICTTFNEGRDGEDETKDHDDA